MSDTETETEALSEHAQTLGGDTAGDAEPGSEPDGAPEPEFSGDAAVEDEFNEQGDDGDGEPDDGAPDPGSEPDGDGEGDDAELAQRVQSQRELEKRSQRLDGENARHAKRVGEIMDEAAADLIPCPVCMDGIAGWIYPPEAQALSPEAIARVRTVIGLPDYTTFQAAAFAIECPDCGGLGEVLTGSHVPGYETATCERCSKMGWVRTSEFVSEPHRAGEPDPIVTGPTVYEANDDDLEVRNLRRRGFTVIPPMQVQGG